MCGLLYFLTPCQTAELTFNSFGTDLVILKLQLIWGSPWDDTNMHYTCVFVCQSEWVPGSQRWALWFSGWRWRDPPLSWVEAHPRRPTHTHTNTHNPTKHYKTHINEAARARIWPVALCCSSPPTKEKKMLTSCYLELDVSYTGVKRTNAQYQRWIYYAFI